MNISKQLFDFNKIRVYIKKYHINTSLICDKVKVQFVRSTSYYAIDHGFDSLSLSSNAYKKITIYNIKWREHAIYGK